MANADAAEETQLLHTLSKRSVEFRRDVEGLRAVAVLLVVAFHYGLPGFSGGFIGVDMFFVISGYIITLLLSSEMRSTGTIKLRDFYARRARRLLPASVLVIAATLVGARCIISPYDQLATSNVALASALYANNLWFIRWTLDYFAPETALNPLLHMWSLSVEEQFYVVWPGLLLLSQAQLVRTRPVWLVAAATSLSFLLCVVLTEYRQPWAFFSSPSRAWEFGAGALASFISLRRSPRLSGLGRALGFCGGALLVASLILIRDQDHFPGIIALMPVLSTLLLLTAGSDAATGRPTLVLSMRPMQWFGKLSYSIYLWHWPVIVLATAAVPHINPIGRFACAGVALALAAASYYCIENPFRTNAWLSARATRSIGFGIILTGLGVLVSCGAIILAKRSGNSPVQRQIHDGVSEPSTAGAHNCLTKFNETTPQPCTFGPAKSSTVVVLFGDSHADQWSTPLAEIAIENNWRLVTYLKASCAIADVPLYSLAFHRSFNECVTWRRRAMDEIVRLHPSRIIVSQFSNFYIDGPLSTMAPHTVPIADWEAGLARTIRQLRVASAPVSIIRDTPTPAIDTGRCLQQAAWRGRPFSVCDRPRAETLDARVTIAESRVAVKLGASFIDLSDRFCSPRNCAAVVAGAPVYRDASHMTTPFARTMKQVLSNALLR